MVEFLRAWLTVYAHDFTSKSFNAIIALLTAQRDLIDAGYVVICCSSPSAFLPPNTEKKIIECRE